MNLRWPPQLDLWVVHRGPARLAARDMAWVRAAALYSGRRVHTHGVQTR